MYVYVCICLCQCVCVCVCVCLYACACMSARVYRSNIGQRPKNSLMHLYTLHHGLKKMHACFHSQTQKCTCMHPLTGPEINEKYMHACTHRPRKKRIVVLKHFHAHIHASSRFKTHACIHSQAQKWTYRVHNPKHSHACAYTHTYTLDCMLTQIHTHTPGEREASRAAQTFSCIYIHTYMLTHTHTPAEREASRAAQTFHTHIHACTGIHTPAEREASMAAQTPHNQCLRGRQQPYTHTCLHRYTHTCRAWGQYGSTDAS
jgi:hypothetical protein